MAKKPKMVLSSRIWKCDVAKLKGKTCVTNKEILEAGRKVGRTRGTFYADVHYIDKNQLPKEVRPKENVFFVAVTMPFTSEERVVDNIEENINLTEEWEHGEKIDSEYEKAYIYGLPKRRRR